MSVDCKLIFTYSVSPPSSSRFILWQSRAPAGLGMFTDHRLLCLVVKMGHNDLNDNYMVLVNVGMWYTLILQDK